MGVHIHADDPKKEDEEEEEEEDGVQVGKDCKNSSDKKDTLIFTYGTLKQGFSNHRLLQDMMCTGDASYLGLCRTADKLPLVCGPYRVPFLLNFQGQGLGHHVWGEIYAVSPGALARMDDLEGVTRGYYQRLSVKVVLLDDDDSDLGVVVTPAEAYYAHPSYAEALWERNRRLGYQCYSQKEAQGYVKRIDRPQHLSFLDQIQLFVSSPSSSSSSSSTTAAEHDDKQTVVIT